jgi:hypothetical protein
LIELTLLSIAHGKPVCLQLTANYRRTSILAMGFELIITFIEFYILPSNTKNLLNIALRATRFVSPKHSSDFKVHNFKNQLDITVTETPVAFADIYRESFCSYSSIFSVGCYF